jgi:hypothetical protein
MAGLRMMFGFFKGLRKRFRQPRQIQQPISSPQPKNVVKTHRLLKIKDNKMSTLTPDQIVEFEKALQGPAPSSDPNWQVTQQLLTLVTLQARTILEQQAQLTAFMGANEASDRALLSAIQNAAGSQKIIRSDISQADLDTAMNNLNQAINDYKSGKKAASFAGSVLKFAAGILVPGVGL